jgi:hypothetical protein
MKGGIKAASNLIVVFYFNSRDIQKISTSTKKVEHSRTNTNSAKWLIVIGP